MKQEQMWIDAPNPAGQPQRKHYPLGPVREENKYSARHPEATGTKILDMIAPTCTNDSATYSANRSNYSGDSSKSLKTAHSAFLPPPQEWVFRWVGRLEWDPYEHEMVEHRWRSCALVLKPGCYWIDEAVAIVGSRDYQNTARIYETVKALPSSTIIISGGARGVDSVAVLAAQKYGLKFEVYPADWNRYGKQAGIIRNGEIVKRADRVIAFWDGKSRGTKGTIDKARAAGVPVEIVYDEMENAA